MSYIIIFLCMFCLDGDGYSEKKDLENRCYLLQQQVHQMEVQTPVSSGKHVREMNTPLNPTFI